jgi:steroid 5-alpha reductase family enzyme
MSFVSIWACGLALNMAVMTGLWLISVAITNVSIIDTYWFVEVPLKFYFLSKIARLSALM